MRRTSSPARRPASASNAAARGRDNGGPTGRAAALGVDEVARAIQNMPHLASSIIAIRDNASLPKEQKMERIASLVRGTDGGDSGHAKSSVGKQQEAERAATPSPLELAQAAWRPTSEQQAGARAAAIEQRARFDAAEAKRIFQPVGRVWSSFGGEILEKELLEHVDLVDARWLVSLHAHGGVVPRWQDVPETAIVNRSNVWRLYAWEHMFSLGVLVLSYPWLDGDHPDTRGEQLARIVPILQHMLAFCGGDEFTVGVLWDYCSLPQPARTPSQQTRFELGLRSLMRWYAHPYTHVLLMTGELPTGAAYTNTRPYDARGWCETERSICGVSKCVHCMWDYSGFAPTALEGLAGMKLYDELRGQLKAGRAPPMAPTKFANRLRARVEAGEIGFSAASDLESVIEMYKVGFITLFETYRAAFDSDGFFAAWAALEWGESEAQQVAAALAYAAKHCHPRDTSRASISLRLEGNCFGKGGQQAIQKAIKGVKMFSEVLS